MKTKLKIVTVLALLCAPLCAQEDWTTQAMPGAVAAHAMIRDTANDRLVVFGGARNGTLSNETWIFDFEKGQWGQLLPMGTAPSPRTDALAAYDSANKRMIVFGGSSAAGYTNDTFALVLTPGEERWIELAAEDVEKPLARTHGNLIVDARNGRAILYGGYRSPSMLRDVWELDLEASEDWRELPTNNHPTGNSYGNAAIYDPVGQRMVVYRAYQSQLVSLSLDRELSWTNHTNSTTSVHGRYLAAAYDSARHEMIIHGGLQSSQSSCEAYRVDLGTMEFTQFPDEPGTGRHWHTAAYDEVRDRFVVVGGRTYPNVPVTLMSTLALLPGTPTGLEPNGDMLITDTEVVLRWKPSEGIGDGRYVVELYRVEGRVLVPQEVEVRGEYAVFVPQEFDNVERSYQWQVMAVNENGASEFSELATFHHIQMTDGNSLEAGSLGDVESVGAEPPQSFLTGSAPGEGSVDAGSVALQASGTTIIGGGSGEAESVGAAGCTGGNGSSGLALMILVVGAAGVAVRRLRRA